MIQESEVIQLVLAAGTAVFLFTNRSALRSVRGLALLAGSFGAFLAASVLTVIEGFLLPLALNAMEHTCYAAAAVLALAWTVAVSRRDSE